MGWHGEGWGSTWIGIVCSHRHGHRYPHAPPPRPTTTPHHTATQARAHLSSLERLLEYLTLPQEPTRLLASDPPAARWPQAGAISFVRTLALSLALTLTLSLTLSLTLTLTLSLTKTLTVTL